MDESKVLNLGPGEWYALTPCCMKHEPETQLFAETVPFGSFVDVQFVTYRDHADKPRNPVSLMVCKHCRSLYLL